MADPTNPPNTSPTPRAAEPSSASLPESSRRVDLSSNDSFPASDPPAWTPVVGTTASPDETDEALTAWHPEGETPHERAMQWVQHACELIDAEHFRAFVTVHLTDDVLFQVGADLQLSGRAAVQAWLERQRAIAGKSTHRVIAVTVEDNTVISEADVTYVREGEPPVHVAEACSYRLRGQEAARVQLYAAAT